MAFARVARLGEIPDGSGLRVRVGDRTLGLYRLGDRVCAMDDVCPHAGYSLSEGDLVGSRIVCPAHGWEFDVVTGLAPGEVDEEPLERFAVEVRDGAVWVDLESPLRGEVS